ncbi:GlxA family transcriptional regulator [Pseudomonas sp. MBLB4136]|uniref:GlxA family transcriptional regulator n=1 Tax=Pseudomonas sp. MBLB4136 TaxID=3451558 RepID=UPI003F74DFD1
MSSPSSTSALATARRQVALVAFPGVQLLDIAGPADVFEMANSFHLEPAYEVFSVSARGGNTATTSGIDIATRAATEVAADRLDTLIVAGGNQQGLLEAIADPPLTAWVRQAAGSARRYASVCSGAFALAEWGLLDGLRATTHWAAAERLQRRYPRIEVQPDAIYVQNGQVWTAGGVSSGIDMCLAMVEQDLGRVVAARVAKQLILPVRRMGNQSQFSLLLESQSSRYGQLIDWLRTHLREPLNVERLADQVGESPRSFYRHFQAETGQSPAAFVETLRLQVAREQLEAGASVKAAARAAGFTSDEQLSRVFARRFSMTPLQYRLTHGW